MLKLTKFSFTGNFEFFWMQTAEMTKRAKFGFGLSRSFYNVINCLDFSFKNTGLKTKYQCQRFFDNFNFLSTLFRKSGLNFSHLSIPPFQKIKNHPKIDAPRPKS